MIRMINESEECLGKYRERKDAEALAESETKRTEKKHLVFLTHYTSPFNYENLSHWTIIRAQEE